jgi:hypothetical protein
MFKRARISLVATAIAAALIFTGMFPSFIPFLRWLCYGGVGFASISFLFGMFEPAPEPRLEPQADRAGFGLVTPNLIRVAP